MASDESTRKDLENTFFKAEASDKLMNLLDKMEEVVKDPTGKEGLDLQAFAESCNASALNQIHLYLFCHRSLKEYHDIS